LTEVYIFIIMKNLI